MRHRLLINIDEEMQVFIGTMKNQKLHTCLKNESVSSNSYISV